jgi:ribosomal-protein-alanine N-acetyltransferase
MFGDRQVSLRPANPADRQALLGLMRHERHVHAHLDWKPVEDWLGAQPYLLAERRRRLIGALACPPDPPHTAWLRLFAAVNEIPRGDVWNLLWPRAVNDLRALGVRQAAAICLDAWVGDLCAAAGFAETHAVVVLSRPRGPLPPAPAAPVPVRAAKPADRAAIAAADLAAFAPPWQMSPAVVEEAIARADFISVAEADGQVVGFQLTTPSASGAHLARLAVQPAWQGQGIGAALVHHLLNYANLRNYREVTVNTQDSNAASLAVYRRLGFQPTGIRYPVFQLNL